MRVHELVDTFTAAGNPLLTYGSGASVADGRLSLVLGANGYVSSTGLLDLTRSRVDVELVEVPVTTRSRVAVVLDAEQFSGDAVWWAIDAGVISAVRIDGGAFTSGWSAPYDPEAHRWLSIRHERDVVVWATSRDGDDWIDRALLLPGIALTSLRLSLTGTLADLDVEGDDGLIAGPARFDNLNAPPAAAPDPLTIIGSDPLAPGIAVDVLPATGGEGVFALDGSELDGGDRLEWGAGSASWLNVVCDVTRVSIRRGATAALGPIVRTEAGTCSLRILDTERRFDPTVNSGTIHPRTPIRVRAYGERPALELVELRRNLVPNPATTGSVQPYAATSANLSIVGGWLRATTTTLATAGPGAAERLTGAPA